mgnify:CR=1 FL=1
MSIFSKIKLKHALASVERKSRVKRYFNFTIGCLLMAISYNLFLASNDIVSGGIGGIAIILNELTSISNSLVISYSSPQDHNRASCQQSSGAQIFLLL